MLISISGVDCSGKTTQVGVLREHLSARGVSHSLVWHRPGYSPLLDTARAWVRRVRPRALPKHGDRKAREQAFGRPGVSRAWATVALVDSIAALGVGVRAQLLRHQVVICDRYVHDALLDLELRFPDLDVPSWLLAKAMAASAPQPHCSILLTLPWQVSLRRSELKNEPFPDAVETRRRRHERYLELAERGAFTHVIDGAGSRQLVAAAVLDAIGPIG